MCILDKVLTSIYLKIYLAMYQKGVYCLGIKLFNSIPSDIKIFSNNPQKFKTARDFFLHTDSFYPLDEYFNVKNVDN